MSKPPHQIKYVDDRIDSLGLIRDTDFIILCINYETNLLITSQQPHHILDAVLWIKFTWDSALYFNTHSLPYTR